MSSIIVGLEEVLAKLGEQGPLPSTTIAHEFGLNSLDTRILMLHAHVRGLVVRTDWGEWKITSLGREAITQGAASPDRDHAHMPRVGWRVAWQRGALFAACAIIIAVAAGVASNLGSSPSRPTEAAQDRLARQLVAGRKESRVLASETTDAVVTPQRRVQRRVVSPGGLRSPARASSLPKLGVPVLDVLAGQGIGRVKFGASPAAVRVAFNGLLGASGGPYLQRNSCGLDHEIDWSSRRGGSPTSRVPVLSAYFKHGRFVGYVYGQYGPVPKPRYSLRGVALASTRGLRIGDPVARGYRLYGRGFAISASQRGVWSATTAHGQLTGLAWGTPQRPYAASQSFVEMIGAGYLGCPSVVP